MSDTSIPEMVPSAEERVQDRMDTCRDSFCQADIDGLVNTAFRDGITAERERIMAMLRSHPPGLVGAMLPRMPTPHSILACRTIISLIADHLTKETGR